MNGKPVVMVPAKSVINFESGFKAKLLCDGPTFSMGSACAYSCSFCYVPAMMRKSPHLKGVDLKHEDVVIRREKALNILGDQLTDRHGNYKYKSPEDRRVIYASPLVDVAGNMELVRETIEACKIILAFTHWQIRLLSKSNLLPKVAQGIPEEFKNRVIYGVSTGTLDDKLAKAFEAGAPLVSKRIESLHWLQDHGYRTFGMICPSLPMEDYVEFARTMFEAVRGDKCEHVWAEVINVRGESMGKTVEALTNAGYTTEAERLIEVSRDKVKWEEYARETFLEHSPHYRKGQLRFLQYVNKSNQEWWSRYSSWGAVCL